MAETRHRRGTGWFAVRGGVRRSINGARRIIKIIENREWKIGAGGVLIVS